MEGKTKRNDNKTIKLKHSKELLAIALHVGSKFLTKDQKIILKEVLINDKTFNELSIKVFNSKYTPRSIFALGYSRLKKGLLEVDSKMKAQEKTIGEITNLNKCLAYKLDDEMKKCDSVEKQLKNK